MPVADCDVAIVGAGAAGLFAAARIARAGRSVILIEHAPKLAEKIRISGGGRCNFTNLYTTPENFLGANPHFCRSALAGFTPQDFIALLQTRGIAWHEKHKGQLFCDDSAQDIIGMLCSDCDETGVELWHPCKLTAVERRGACFVLASERGDLHADNLVVATGGLSIPKIGASDFGMRVARQFGHRIIEPRPALVPLTFSAAHWQRFVELAGVSLEVEAGCTVPAGERAVRFVEDLLFTHRGLSGPAILQASSYWRHGSALSIDLVPGVDIVEALLEAKRGARHQLGKELASHLPARLAASWLAQAQLDATQPIAQMRDSDLRALGASLKGWQVEPDGSEGWRKAEVMAGGVDTRQLNSRSLQSELVPGLFFIGEVVDVTGWLGGYNFQWAWASAAACARALAH